MSINYTLIVYRPSGDHDSFLDVRFPSTRDDLIDDLAYFMYMGKKQYDSEDSFEDYEFTLLKNGREFEDAMDFGDVNYKANKIATKKFESELKGNKNAR